MKCIKLLLTKYGYIYNMGNYIMIPILFFNIIISMIFRFKGYNLLKNKIKIFYEQFKEYLKNNNNGFLAHKNIEIYNKNKIKKPKRIKRKSVRDRISFKKENISLPPKKKYKKSKSIVNINFESINGLKLMESKLNLNKKKTMNMIENNKLNLNDKTQTKKKERKIINKIPFYNDSELNDLDY